MNQFTDQICVAIGCHSNRSIRNQETLDEHQMLGHQIMQENKFVLDIQTLMEEKQNAFLNYSKKELQDLLQDYENQFIQYIKEFTDEVFEFMRREIVENCKETFDFISISDEIQNREVLENFVQMFNNENQTQPLIKDKKINFQLAQIELKLQRLEIQIQSALSDHLNMISVLTNKNYPQQDFQFEENYYNTENYQNIQKQDLLSTDRQQIQSVKRHPDYQLDEQQTEDIQQEFQTNNKGNVQKPNQQIENNSQTQINNLFFKQEVIDIYRKSNTQEYNDNEQQQRSDAIEILPLKGYKNNNQVKLSQELSENEVNIPQIIQSNNKKIRFISVSTLNVEQIQQPPLNIKVIRDKTGIKEINLDQQFDDYLSDSSLRFKNNKKCATFKNLGIGFINTLFTLDQDATVSFNITGNQQNYCLALGIINMNIYVKKRTLKSDMKGVYCIEQYGQLYNEGEEVYSRSNYPIVPNLKLSINYSSETRTVTFCYQDNLVNSLSNQVMHQNESIKFWEIQIFHLSSKSNSKYCKIIWFLKYIKQSIVNIILSDHLSILE